MSRAKIRKGFTAVELMIVVAVIGILAVIAAAIYFKAYKAALRNTCIENLRQIQGSVQLWAVSTGAASNAALTTADIVPEYMKSWPKEGTAEYPVPSSANSPVVCPNSGTNKDHCL